MNTNQLTTILIILSCLTSCKPLQFLGFEVQPKDSKLEIVEPLKPSFPESLGYISDFESVFSEKQRLELEKMLIAYEKKTTREIVVITVNSIEPYPNISEYTTALARNWGVGKAGKDNGLMLLFSESLGQIRISTGLGTEKILTDEICKNIIDQIITPLFRERNYFEGVYLGLLTLMRNWE